MFPEGSDEVLGHHDDDDSISKTEASLLKMDTGQPPLLAWKRSLRDNEREPLEFRLTMWEKLQMAHLGIRLGRHIIEESVKGQVAIIDPLRRRIAATCHGVPLGGIG